MAMSIAVMVSCLVLLGPIAAIILARYTGGLTWARVLLWAVVCQVLAVLFYLRPDSLPTIVYPATPGAVTVKRPVAEIALSLVVIALGVAVAALMTPVARRLARD